MSEYRNEAAERTLAVLRCVADAPSPPSLSEVASGTGLSMPTALRYLDILARAGYVDRDPRSRRFVPGFEAVSLASGGDEAGAPLRRAARHALHDAAGFHGILHVAMLRGRRLVHVARLEVGGCTVARSCAGRSYDPLTSVAGRALLATFAPRRLDELLVGVPASTAGRAGDAIADARAGLAQRGCHADTLEPGSGMICVAVPVRRPHRERLFAACVTVPAVRRNGRFPESLVLRAATIARRVGEALP